MMKEPVDAIITWVDGNEKKHKEKLESYLSKLGRMPEAAAKTRFAQLGEINYCVRSLLRFAPWIRTIFILTDAQTPSIIKEFQNTPFADKIKLIDHKEVFLGLEDCLPTFNSITIESVLWRIKGLANQYIYLNDDCALIRPVSYEDFFRNNQLVLRGKWKVQLAKKWRSYFKRWQSYLLKKPYQPIASPIHRSIQEVSARLAGWNKHFFHLHHMPFPVKRKTLEDFFHQYPEHLLQNVRHKLRHKDQFWSVSLAYHLEIKNKDVIFDNTLEAVCINGDEHSLNTIQYRLAHADKNNNVAFICIQSIDAASEPDQALVFNWLDNRIMS